MLAPIPAAAFAAVPGQPRLSTICAPGQRRLGTICVHLGTRKQQPGAVRLPARPAPTAGILRWARGLLGGAGHGRSRSEQPVGEGSVGGTASPSELGLDPAKLQAAWDFMSGLVEAAQIPGCCVAVGRGTARERRLPVFTVGCSGPEAGDMNQGLAASMPLAEDSIFLVASVTKPVVTTAVLMLVERGQLGLDDFVQQHIPEFVESNKSASANVAGASLSEWLKPRVTLRHLLTHTSGLPDACEQNHELRRTMQPLSAFTAAMCNSPLLFEPGTNISYSSVALNLLGEIVSRVSGHHGGLSGFLKAEIFAPLGMVDSQCGIGADRKKAREVCLNLVPGYSGSDSGRAFQESLPSANWNSDYWRELGAPWGGLTTTVGDMTTFLQCVLGGGAALGLSAETCSLMTTPHTHGPDATVALPESIRREAAWGGKPPSCWGLGWRANEDGAEKKFGENTSSQIFGHHGAVGTMVWADPVSGLTVAAFTPEPDMCYSAEFNTLSDLIYAALDDAD